jgi:uracil-DNA glycosylase family 4
MNGEASTAGPSDAAQTLRALADSLRDCSKCGLCGSRTQVVFGVGNAQAELVFVGEGPGFHEDRLGEPFVGQAGKLLTELLSGIGLARADVYIANVVKCRPPENRDPAPDEIEACSPHLMEQIGIIRPKVICTLGRFATKLLAETELSMTAVHGKAKARTVAGVDTVVFPVFHPAAALYAPANRQVLVDDFGKLRILLERGLNAASPAPGDETPVAAGTVGDDSTVPSIGAPPKPGLPHTEQLHLW